MGMKKSKSNLIIFMNVCWLQGLSRAFQERVVE